MPRRNRALREDWLEELFRGPDLTRHWKIPGVGVDTLSECDNISDRQEWPGVRSDEWPESRS